MASGDLYGKFGPLGSWGPTSNYATPDMTAAPHPVLDFDDATDEVAYFGDTMDSGYGGSAGLTVVIGWRFTTHGGGASTCAWKAAFYRIADDADSIASYTFASDQTVTDTEASATGELSYASITFTNAQADGIQPREEYVLRITRDAASGTASPGDAELAFVQVKET